MLLLQKHSQSPQIYNVTASALVFPLSFTILNYFKKKIKACLSEQLSCQVELRVK